MRRDDRARTPSGARCGYQIEMRVDGGRKLRFSSRVPAARDRGRPHIAHGSIVHRVLASPDMAATLTVADVERIAALAQLELTDEEKELFTRQLADILAYAEQLRSVNTTGVPATAHVLGERIEREDAARPSLAVEEAVANAPDAAPATGLFRVPRVIG